MSAMRAVCMDCTSTRLCARHRAEKDSQVQKDMAAAQEMIAKARELGFRWEEPATLKRGRSLLGELEPILAVLRTEPGKWACIRTYPSESGANGATGSLRRRPPKGRWEFTRRKNKLYARYLGPEDGSK